MQRDHTILSRFPKQRPELPEAYRAIYAAHYRQNREGGSPASFLSRMMESWMHRKVAADVARDGRRVRTLEIGGGNLNHLRYEHRRKNMPSSSPSRTWSRILRTVLSSLMPTRSSPIFRISSSTESFPSPRLNTIAIFPMLLRDARSSSHPTDNCALRFRAKARCYGRWAIG